MAEAAKVDDTPESLIMAATSSTPNLATSSGGKKKTRKVQKNLVIIGDGGCGKSYLVNVWMKGIYPSMYRPTVFDDYVREVEIDDGKVATIVELVVKDTAGQEDFDALRPYSYIHGDVIAICFGVNSLDSLENVWNKWVGEVQKYCMHVPVVLVANKSDLRIDEGNLKMKNVRLVTEAEGLQMANRINAAAYIECSAKTKENVDLVFETIARAAISAEIGEKKAKKKKSRCETI